MGDRHWFDYPVRIQPQHTDYAGVVWHGAYIGWMESARTECLRSNGIGFDDWLSEGIDLPVVDMVLKYRQPLRIGDEAVVKICLQPLQGVRLVWEYDIQNRDTGATCVVGSITLVPVDLKKRKILRQLPPYLSKPLEKLSPS